MIVLGVDPGSRATGFGLIEKQGERITCIQSGRITSPASRPFYERIHRIFIGILDIMNQFHPEQMAIEDIFYAKNVKSSLKLGHARGAVLIAAVQSNVRIFEYSPLEIKKAVVGYGRADKEQVRNMVSIMLNLKTCPPLDTSDALAAAICHLNTVRFQSVTEREIR